LKIVNDLGEEKMPEPQQVQDAEAKVDSTSSAESSSTETLAPSSNPSTSDTETDKAGEALPTTNIERKPMSIPSSVHIRVTPENLKEYVGPAVYQKDRMFGGTVKTDGTSLSLPCS
jgi:ATP-dependent Lon protease